MSGIYNGAVKLLDAETKRSYYRHIGAWERSTLSQSAYCREHELNKHTFSYLRGKYLQEQKLNQSGVVTGFAELKSVDLSEQVGSSSEKFTIHLESGAQVELPLGLGQDVYTELFLALGVVA